MKRTLIHTLPADLPDELARLADGARVYDSSCSPEARVYFIEKDGGYYLKSAPRGALANEAAMAGFFHQKGLGAEVLSYRSEERDWLLTARVAGEDCTHAAYLADPKRLAETTATLLRALHEIDPAHCPVQDHTARYFATAARNYRAGMFDLSFLDGEGSLRAEEAWRITQESRPLFQNEVLLHGDYCLPNIMLDHWRFSGFIDLGNGGLGDRHVDLFWGAWTLRYNLKTDRYCDIFFDAYGREAINPTLLRAIAAIETFG